MGVIALIIGVGSLVNWWFVMFSDCWYAEFQRELSKAWFNLGRNTESLITPAAGIMMLFGGWFLFLIEGGGDRRSWTVVCVGVVCLASMALAMLGMFPFRLPGPMYPEWQLERRRRRAAQSGAGGSAGSADAAEEAWWRAGYPSGGPDTSGHPD